jgi:hypothetical protein
MRRHGRLRWLKAGVALAIIVIVGLVAYPRLAHLWHRMHGWKPLLERGDAAAWRLLGTSGGASGGASGAPHAGWAFTKGEAAAPEGDICVMTTGDATWRDYAFAAQVRIGTAPGTVRLMVRWADAADTRSAKPNTVVPGAAKHNPAEPGAAEQGGAKPSTAEHDTAQHNTTEPGAAKPDALEPGGPEQGAAGQGYYVELAARHAPAPMGKIALCKAAAAGGETLKVADIDLKESEWYHVCVDVRGTHVRVLLDGREILAADDATYAAGRVGLASLLSGAHFRDIEIKLAK